MTQADLVEIRAAADRAASGSKVTVERITVVEREPRYVELTLRGAKDIAVAVRACAAVARVLHKVAPLRYAMVVVWETAR